MAGVLEDVEGGHGGVGEAVHEQGLELAFEVVDHDQGAGEGLQGGRLGRCRLVDVGSQVVDEGVDEEGAGVFDEEDGAPIDLRAWRDA